ncbi:ABC transporter ATP-binding protein [candidate division KSB1 bacterium]|nr:ABC transporter ATP-binding protein [candidate division KSB1 bacterium]
MNNNYILKTFDLHKSYLMGRGLRLHVLKGIYLEAREGEIIAVMGPSGVGKSTLLHLIGALDRPSAGTIQIDHTDLASFNDMELAQFRNKTIGFVFQAHHLLPEFSAVENVMIPGMIAGQQRAELQERALQLLLEVGLEDRTEHRPNELSGGEQQRVAVARALLNQPRLLLADEPSGNLDKHTADALHTLLWQLSRLYNTTLIIVTHNPDLAKQADRIIELEDGRIKNLPKAASNVM